MSNETKPMHTPLPWLQGKPYVEEIHSLRKRTVAITNANDRRFEPEDEANAEFIVRACNSHYDLLEALRYARRFLNPVDHDVAFVDAAIAKGELA